MKPHHILLTIGLSAYAVAVLLPGELTHLLGLPLAFLAGGAFNIAMNERSKAKRKQP